ncbi:MAG: TetR/AcrR family transcriptional regulator [Halioglobus sp.]
MAKNQSNEKDNNYHHGDLRNTLIIAAAELIEESGSTEFAMIDAARRAGVSSAAPYRHFKDKDGLLEAVAHLGFIELKNTMAAVLLSHDSGSEEAIIAIGKNYVDFVTGHPQFFDLMWGEMGVKAMSSDAIDLQASGFYILVEAVEAWCGKAQVASQSPAELAVKLWAMVHGLSSLAMNGHIGKFIDNVDVNDLIETSTHTFLAGLRS